MNISDPIEKMLAAAFDAAGIAYIHESEDVAGLTKGLDFFLPGFETHVEVKQFHSPRIAKQMSRADNVIAIQGRGAAASFVAMLNWTPE